MAKDRKTVTPLLADASGNPLAFVHVPHVVTENGVARVVNVQVAIGTLTEAEFVEAFKLVQSEAAKHAKQ